MLKYEDRKKIPKDKDILKELINNNPNNYRKVLAYLYSGEELEVNGYTLFMDGDTNLFTKATREVKEKPIENVLLCVNNMFNEFIEQAYHLYKDDKKKMFIASATLVLYGI